MIRYCFIKYDYISYDKIYNTGNAHSVFFFFAHPAVQNATRFKADAVQQVNTAAVLTINYRLIKVLYYILLKY